MIRTARPAIIPDRGVEQTSTSQPHIGFWHGTPWPAPTSPWCDGEMIAGRVAAAAVLDLVRCCSPLRAHSVLRSA